MKKLLFIIALGILSNSLFAQISNVHKIFEKYQNVDGITSIKVSKPMFNILRNLDIQDETLKNIQPLLSKVNSLNILITEEPLNDSILQLKPGLKTQSEKMQLLQSEITNAVKALHYEELVTVNNDGRKIKLLTLSAAGDVLNNLLLSITGNGKNILMLLDGEVPTKEVSKFISGDK